MDVDRESTECEVITIGTVQAPLGDYTAVSNDLIRKASDIPGNAFKVAVYLMSHKPGFKVTWDTIADAVGCVVNTVKTAVALLVAKGVLMWRGKTIHMASKPSKNDDSSTSEPSKIDDQNRQKLTEEPSKIDALYKEPSEQPKKNTLTAPDGSEFTRPAAPTDPIDWDGLFPELEQAPKPPPPMARFDEFWSVYPRKAGKGEARKKFLKAAEKVPVDTLIAAAMTFRDDPNRVDRFTPHPATWLHQERWEDETAAPAPVTSLVDRRTAELDAFDRKWGLGRYEAANGTEHHSITA